MASAAEIGSRWESARWLRAALWTMSMVFAALDLFATRSIGLALPEIVGTWLLPSVFVEPTVGGVVLVVLPVAGLLALFCARRRGGWPETALFLVLVVLITAHIRSVTAIFSG